MSNRFAHLLFHLYLLQQFVFSTAKLAPQKSKQFQASCFQHKNLPKITLCDLLCKVIFWSVYSPLYPAKIVLCPSGKGYYYVDHYMNEYLRSRIFGLLKCPIELDSMIVINTETLWKLLLKSNTCNLLELIYSTCVSV